MFLTHTLRCLLQIPDGFLALYRSFLIPSLNEFWMLSNAFLHLWKWMCSFSPLVCWFDTLGIEFKLLISCSLPWVTCGAMISSVVSLWCHLNQIQVSTLLTPRSISILSWGVTDFGIWFHLRMPSLCAKTKRIKSTWWWEETRYLDTVYTVFCFFCLWSYLWEGHLSVYPHCHNKPHCYFQLIPFFSQTPGNHQQPFLSLHIWPFVSTFYLV